MLLRSAGREALSAEGRGRGGGETELKLGRTEDSRGRRYR
jgi:hypothetical protein